MSRHDAFGVDRPDLVSKGWRDPKLENVSRLPKKGSPIYRDRTKANDLETVITRKKDSLILRRPRYEAAVQTRNYDGPMQSWKFKNKTAKEGAKIAHKQFQSKNRPKTGTGGLPVRWVDAR